MPADFPDEVRVSYDAVARAYAGRSHVDEPWGPALLAAFERLVVAGGGGPVADVGCGPGLVTARLAGVDAFGIDVSPGMLAQARASFPGVRFVEGSMTGLPLADGSLGGIVAWYSIIHVADGVLPGVFAGFHRVLRPGGHVLLAFQTGDVSVRLTEAFGVPVALDFHRRAPGRVEDLLGAAGFRVVARTERAAGAGERAGRAYVLAVKPDVGGGTVPAPDVAVR